MFVEYSSQDEGVSLTATPGSSTNNTNHAPELNNTNTSNNNNNNNQEEVECDNNSRSRDDSMDDNDVDSITHDARNGVAPIRSQQRDAGSDVSSSRLETVDSMMNAR